MWNLCGCICIAWMCFNACTCYTPNISYIIARRCARWRRLSSSHWQTMPSDHRSLFDFRNLLQWRVSRQGRLPLTSALYWSLLISTYHYLSLLITTYHYLSLLIYHNHGKRPWWTRTSFENGSFAMALLNCGVYRFRQSWQWEMQNPVDIKTVFKWIIHR